MNRDKPFASRQLSEPINKLMPVIAKSSLIGALVAFNGCVWHGPEAKHYLGPVWIRKSQGKAEVTQTIHGPILLEGGKQWGTTVGISRRLSADPAHETTANKAAPSQLASDWHFSPFYQRIENPHPVEFSATTLWGLRMAAGTELNALSLGYARRTEFQPRKHGYYLLHYTSRHPEAMELRFDAEHLPASSDTKKQQNKP